MAMLERKAATVNGTDGGLSGRTRWSARSDACCGCGTIGAPHYSLGLCRRCYASKRRAGGTDDDVPPKRWCTQCDACLGCGATTVAHVAHGLCKRCYERSPDGPQARYRKTEGRHQSHRAWKSRNAEAEAIASRRRSRRTARLRRGTRFGVVDAFDPGIEDLVFEVFGRACLACGTSERITLDHHRPLRKGHALLHNAVPLCVACNKRKGNKNPETFYDGWKLAEILVGLHETRDRFEDRFGSLLPEAREVA